MKVAILSDIHGNFEALKCVWADIKQNEIDNIVGLGDMIGYGPQPESVAKFIIEKRITTVVGNHELAIPEDAQLADMSDDARASILLTRKLISDNTRVFIKQLPLNYILKDMLFVHGMPPDSATTYLNWVGDAEIVSRMKAVTQRMIFVGHTHRPICYSLDESDLDVIFLPEGITQLSKDAQYIVNVGSVGQPRDGDTRSKYVIYDTEADTIELRLVAYHIQNTADQIIELGFPRFNAQRLFGPG